MSVRVTFGKRKPWVCPYSFIQETSKSVQKMVVSSQILHFTVIIMMVAFFSFQEVVYAPPHFPYFPHFTNRNSGKNKSPVVTLTVHQCWSICHYRLSWWYQREKMRWQFSTAQARPLFLRKLSPKCCDDGDDSDAVADDTRVHYMLWHWSMPCHIWTFLMQKCNGRRPSHL